MTAACARRSVVDKLSVDEHLVGTMSGHTKDGILPAGDLRRKEHRGVHLLRKPFSKNRLGRLKICIRVNHSILSP